MMLAPTHRPRHVALAALALAIVAATRTAAAQPTPSDLPAVPTRVAPGTPVTPGTAVTPGAPVTPGATPGTAVTPGMPPNYGPPSPSMWPTPSELPPGYAAPGYYQAPYPMQTVPLNDPYALPPLPARRRHDNGLFVGGVFMVSGGMALVLLGAYFVASAAERIDIYCDTPSFPCAHKTDGPRLTGGALLMTVGTLAGAAGIPMWFIGSQYELTPKGEKKATLVPEVRVGAGTGSLTFHF
jgi:hypothetical protein